ncbi:two-component response regulator [Calothrix sp. NIES-4071]|nr:two-component response regulator [Calothrix sp. NIES-4071]BAZ63737.1 two-component response regulator [Calothrix sp. NIES-4105]
MVGMQTLSKHLLEELQTCTQLRYSGKLIIKSPLLHTWNFYYRFGRIIWANGGSHPCRRWYRQITSYCSNIEISKIKIRAVDLALEHWDYQSIIALNKRNKIESKQVEIIAENVIQEILFDLIQYKSSNDLICIRDSQVILDLAVTFTSTDIFIERAESQLKTWTSAGLRNCFPDLAPQIQKPEELKKIVSPAVYNNLITFVNGKHTLRDLSVLLKQDFIKITVSLLPHISKGLIQLVTVPDLPFPGSANLDKIPLHNSQHKNSTTALIACIDDSLQVCQILEQIIVSNGMRFIKIQDAVQALPKVIEHKPDLILLDLIMPVVNGYEICSQLRRISGFAETPIIILTGSDGLLDRMRAKVVGSTDFLSKPIVADKILEALRKYLPSHLSHSIPEIESLQETQQQ